MWDSIPELVLPAGILILRTMKDAQDQHGCSAVFDDEDDDSAVSVMGDPQSRYEVATAVTVQWEDRQAFAVADHCIDLAQQWVNRH